MLERSAAFLLLLLASACIAVRMPEEEWKGLASELAEDSGLEIPAGDSWDPKALQGHVCCGSRALYRLERSNGGGEIEGWDLEIEAPASPSSRAGDYVVSSTEADGSERCIRASAYRGRFIVRREGAEPMESETHLALGFLAQGIFRDCENCWNREEGHERSAEESLDSLLAGACFLSMTEAVNGNREMALLLLKVVQLPSFWTWVVPTFNCYAESNNHEAVPTTTPFGPAFRYPVEIEIKGDPALYLNLTVVEPAGVLEMTGGVVEAVGFAPDRPEQEIRLRFVGARLREGDDPGESIVASYEFVNE